MSPGQHKRSNESGQSFIDLLFGVALSGIILAGISKVLVDSSRARKKIEIASELESVRQIMVKSFSCSESLGPAAGEAIANCKIPIKDSRGALLVDERGHVPGSEFYLRLRCQNEVGLFFEYLRAKASSTGLTPLEDPLTGKRKSDYQELFPSEPFCNEYFGNAPSAEPSATASIPNVICAAGRVFLGFSGGKPVCQTLEQDLMGPPVYTAIPTPPVVTQTCLTGILFGQQGCFINTGGNPVNFMEGIRSIGQQPICNFAVSNDNGLTYTEFCS